MSTPRVALVALLIALLAPSLKATAIVIFRQADGTVVVASDGAQQVQRGDEVSRVRRCKIQQAGAWWTTLSGFTSSGALDVQALLIKEISSSRTMEAVGHALRGRVYPRISAELERVRHTSGFRELFASGEWISSLVIAGTNADDAILRVGIFVIVLDAIEPFKLTTAFLQCPGWCPDGVLYFGATVDPLGPAIALLKPPRAAWVQRGDTAAAGRVIAAQIAATPTLVSAPIDIMELRAGRAQWVQRDPSSTCSPVHP